MIDDSRPFRISPLFSTVESLIRLCFTLVISILLQLMHGTANGDLSYLSCVFTEVRRESDLYEHRPSS